MKAVLDTNILVAAALGRSRDRWARARWLVDVGLVGQRRFEHVTSSPIIEELRSVLLRPGMVEQRFADALRETLLLHSTVVRIHGVPMGCRDPGDDKIVETALAGGAGVIVSDDRDLLDFDMSHVLDSLGRTARIAVVSLDDFVAQLHEGPRFSPLVAPEVLPATLAA